MSTPVLSNHELRQRSAELRARLREWDPLGVMHGPDSSVDEYDGLVGPLLTLLSQGAGESVLAQHLRAEMTEHFGLAADEVDCAEVAKRLRRWFDLGWRDVGELVVLFVALLDEGTDVWRPVQARELGRGRFRIIGAQADTRDERWQFPPGSIVNCEQRRFADGSSGRVAIDLVEQAD